MNNKFYDVGYFLFATFLTAFLGAAFLTAFFTTFLVAIISPPFLNEFVLEKNFLKNIRKKFSKK